MSKLIAIDLDGTLLNSKKKISKQNIKTIKYYHEKGLKFTICTGRTMDEINYIDNIKEVLPYTDYLIYTNGAYCIDRHNKEVFNYPFHSDDVSLIHSKLNHMDMFFEVYTDGKVHCDENSIKNYKDYISPDFQQLVKDTRNVVPDLLEHAKNAESGVQMLLISFLNEKEMKKAYNNVKDMGYYMSFAGKKGIELNAKDVNKGKGISSLSQHLNIEKSNVISIGDSYNDLSMRDSSNILVSMGNGIDELKEISDFITKSNDEDGVHHALKELLN